MLREEKIELIKRRVRAWVLSFVFGLAVLFFGHFLEDKASGMGESIISLGLIWIGISVLLLIVNLYVVWSEKKKPTDDDELNE